MSDAIECPRCGGVMKDYSHLADDRGSKTSSPSSWCEACEPAEWMEYRTLAGEMKSFQKPWAWRYRVYVNPAQEAERLRYHAGAMRVRKALGCKRCRVAKSGNRFGLLCCPVPPHDKWRQGCEPYGDCGYEPKEAGDGE